MADEQPNGKDYRVKASHPRRPGPLRITGKDGTLIAESGQMCDHVSAKDLASMLRNGYVERVERLRPVKGAPLVAPEVVTIPESPTKGGA